MNPPGWYTDPAGAPHTFRWWDGQAWTAATTQSPATTPPPLPSGGPATPTAGRSPKKILLGVGIGVVALALIIAGVWWALPRLFAEDDQIVRPTPSPSAGSAPASSGTGQQSPSAGGGSSADLNCAAGNQNATGSELPIYSSAGLQYEAVDDWGFRYDKTQWTWLDDQAVWGTTEIEPADEDWAAGIAIGGVRRDNGFTDQATAASGLITCLTRYGFVNDGNWKATEEESKDVTVDGMPGHRASYLLSDGSKASFPGYRVVVLVLDTGSEGSFGTWMSFGPKGEATTTVQLETAEKSIAKS